MRQVKIGLASINPTVGAIDSNCERLIDVAAEMAHEQVDLGAFTEQVVSGYPTEDLVQWRGFVEAQWVALERFAKATERFEYSTAFAVGLAVEEGGLIYNAVALVAAGSIAGIVPKENLPLYDVFYEQRTFSMGLPATVRSIQGIPFGDLIFRLPFGIVAIEVCEDLWVPNGPMLRRSACGAEIVVNVSASPWRSGIRDTRQELISTRAADNQVTLVYVNQFGGQDSLVFDGGGFVNQNGQMLLEAERWREGWTSYVVDLDRTARLRSQDTTWRAQAEGYLGEHPAIQLINVNVPSHADAETEHTYPVPQQKSFFLPGKERKISPEERWYKDILLAMQTGLAGYFEKTGAFECIGIALSGGKDSALTLIVAWLYAKERLGESSHRMADFIHCFSMPTRFNSDTTKNISRLLCEELGVSFKEISIEQAFEREVEATCSMLGEEQELSDITRQNIQARLRGGRMWNWCNSSQAMWIQTGNMSEKAVGYTTVGGDLMGAYSLLGNLPKTIVIRLLHYLKGVYRFKALDILLRTKASAELSENQEDEKELMPFPVLDACFALFAGEKLMPVELYRALRVMWTDEELTVMSADYRPGMLKVWVKQFLRLFVGSIFKWVQAPQAVHLGTLDLDRERALQLPVVQSMEWLDIDAIDEL